MMSRFPSSQRHATPEARAVGVVKERVGVVKRNAYLARRRQISAGQACQCLSHLEPAGWTTKLWNGCRSDSHPPTCSTAVALLSSLPLRVSRRRRNTSSTSDTITNAVRSTAADEQGKMSKSARDGRRSANFKSNEILLCQIFESTLAGHTISDQMPDDSYTVPLSRTHFLTFPSRLSSAHCTYTSAHRLAHRQPCLPTPTATSPTASPSPFITAAVPTLCRKSRLPQRTRRLPTLPSRPSTPLSLGLNLALPQ